jgi:hypothetical protein
MRFEDINDPIEMIAVFRAGKMRPLRFRWRDRVYKIVRINGGWISDQGKTRFYHFSVMSESPDVYEISYNPDRFSWSMDRVCLEG